MSEYPKQWRLENGSAVLGDLQTLSPSGAEVAIVFHAYYTDLWQEVFFYLKTLTTPYDLYISVPPHIKDVDITPILQDAPEATIYAVENRGRDVLPFLTLLDIIGTTTYPYMCKLHSKKTGGSALGEVWRKLLYFDLLGSQETVEKTLALLKQPSIGMVTGKKIILDSKLYLYGNEENIQTLTHEAGLAYDEAYTFAGGTMFWVETSLLEPIMKLFGEDKLIFEEEYGQKDDTLAHAIERFFGIVAKAQGKSLEPSPSQYDELTKSMVEDMASLVLSQAYHSSKGLLDKLQDNKNAIAYYEELVESMRLKNRLKRLLKAPLTIVSKLPIPTPPARIKKVWFYAKRGEFRYLASKIKQKLTKHHINDDNIETYADFWVEKPHIEPLAQSIDIIIPVYNGMEYLEALFNSLQKYTDPKHRLIIINDASPDETIFPYLEKQVKQFENSLLLNNKENLGFVQSVNRAVKETKNHFVILNTDAEVPSQWLERLMQPIVSDPKIASVTPFTNAGTIASFPNFIEDNPIFLDLDVNTLDTYFKHVDPTLISHVPTGVGFCMGVNKDIVNAIDFFDEDTFNKGYGEENDWCQRAIKSGYTNIMIPNLFVYHKHGGSFNHEAKKRYIEENLIKLNEKHPNYSKDVDKYVKQNPYSMLRSALSMIISAKTNPHTQLIFDHALGGGANDYTHKRITKRTQENQDSLLVQYDFYSAHYRLTYTTNSFTQKLNIKTFETLEAFLSKLQFKEIFVNELVSFPKIEATLTLLTSLKTTNQAKLIFPIHDYFSICPNYTLLSNKDTVCDISTNVNSCQECLEDSNQDWTTFMHEKVELSDWRRYWGEFLKACDEIQHFSYSSKDLLSSAYLNLSSSKFNYQPHTIDPLPKITMPPKTSGETKVVAILGAINHAKGASIIKELVHTIDKAKLNINVVVIGELTEHLKSPRLKVTGRYKKNNLPTIIQNNKIDIFLIPSICPETFSYTTAEIMSMDLPLMVFNLGAPAERVQTYDKGYVLPYKNIESIINTIQNL